MKTKEISGTFWSSYSLLCDSSRDLPVILILVIIISFFSLSFIVYQIFDCDHGSWRGGGGQESPCCCIDCTYLKYVDNEKMSQISLFHALHALHAFELRKVIPFVW